MSFTVLLKFSDKISAKFEYQMFNTKKDFSKTPQKPNYIKLIKNTFKDHQRVFNMCQYIIRQRLINAQHIRL